MGRVVHARSPLRLLCPQEKMKMEVGGWTTPVLKIDVGPFSGTRAYQTFIAHPVDVSNAQDGNTP